MPCLAMGIPVVFITEYDPLYPTGYRLDPLRDLCPIYQVGDEIDWSPEIPDISAKAEEIRLRVRSLVL